MYRTSASRQCPPDRVCKQAGIETSSERQTSSSERSNNAMRTVGAKASVGRYVDCGYVSEGNERSQQFVERHSYCTGLSSCDTRNFPRNTSPSTLTGKKNLCPQRIHRR